MPPPPETVEVDFLSPRHLAGGGDPAWVTVPLHRACGWSHGDDPLMPRVLLSSPNQKALLRLEPGPDDQWWTLQHAAEPDWPTWYASFGARTPVEFIAAVTDALTGPAPAAETPIHPYGALRKSGWTREGDNGLVSPDNTAYVERLGTRANPAAWCVTVTLGMHQKVWQARFGEHTPQHLITAFTTALADTRPLTRTDSPHRLPTLNPGLITREPTQVRAVLLASALDERVRTLAARHAAPATAQRPARQLPSTNGRRR